MPKRERYLWVCTNRRPDGHPKGSCGEQGSVELQLALKAACNAAGLQHRVRVCTSGCLDLCWVGPAVGVMPDGVFLGNITAGDVPSIVAALSAPGDISRDPALAAKIVRPEQFDEPKKPGDGGARMSLGLTFHEHMHGSWHRLASPGEEHPMELDADATLRSLGHLRGEGNLELRGRIAVAGLTAGGALEGTLGLGALVRERRLPYSVRFRGDDGRAYTLDGAKEVALLDLRRSLATLPAYVLDDAGVEVGRAVLRVGSRAGIWRFLRTWRAIVT